MSQISCWSFRPLLVISLVFAGSAAAQSTALEKWGPAPFVAGGMHFIRGHAWDYDCTVGTTCVVDATVDLNTDASGQPYPLGNVTDADIEIFITRWYYHVKSDGFRNDGVSRVAMAVAERSPGPFLPAYDQATGNYHFKVTADVVMPNARDYEIGVWFTIAVKDRRNGATPKVGHYTESLVCSGTTQATCTDAATSIGVAPSPWQSRSGGIRSFDVEIVGGTTGLPTRLLVDWSTTPNGTSVDHDLTCGFLANGPLKDVSCTVHVVGIVADPSVFISRAGTGVTDYSFSWAQFGVPPPTTLSEVVNGGEQSAGAGQEKFDLTFDSGPSEVYRMDTGCFDFEINASTNTLYVSHDARLLDDVNIPWADFTVTNRCNVLKQR